MENLKRDPKKTNWVKKQTGFIEETENHELMEKKTEITNNSEEKKENIQKEEKPAKEKISKK